MSKTNDPESEKENNETKYKKDINTHFKLPIFHNSKKKFFLKIAPEVAKIV